MNFGALGIRTKQLKSIKFFGPVPMAWPLGFHDGVHKDQSTILASCSHIVAMEGHNVGFMVENVTRSFER